MWFHMPIVCVEYKTVKNGPSYKINNHNKIEIVLVAVKQLKRVERDIRAIYVDFPSIHILHVQRYG